MLDCENNLDCNLCWWPDCRGKMMTAMSRQQQRHASSRGIAQQSQKTTRKLNKTKKRKMTSSEKQGEPLCVKGADPFLHHCMQMMAHHVALPASAAHPPSDWREGS